MSKLMSCLAAVVLGLGVFTGAGFDTSAGECPPGWEWDPILKQCYPVDHH